MRKSTFALLVIAVIALASSLVVNKVGAHSEGNVVFLRVDTGTERPMSCALSTVDKKNDVCASMGSMKGMLAECRIKLLDRDFQSRAHRLPIQSFGAASRLSHHEPARLR